MAGGKVSFDICNLSRVWRVIATDVQTWGEASMSSQNEVPGGATIVITTGAEAKLFVNKGSAQDIRIEFIGNLEPVDLNDDGPAGKSAPDMSKAELDEATFSKQLAGHLYKQVHSGEIGKIVLIADPDTLGELRPLLHKEVQDAIVSELAKTLTNHSVDHIERSLRSA